MNSNEQFNLEDAENNVENKLDPKRKTLIIPVEKPELENYPNQLKVDGNIFAKKSEFHITAISFSKAKEIKDLFKDKPDLEDRLNKIISNLDWENIVLNEEIFHIKQDKEIKKQLSKKEKKALKNEGKEVVDSITETIHREAIIQMAELPAIQELYKKAKESGVDLGDPPLVHITLYTYGDASGIAINSQEDLESFKSKRIDIN